MTKAATIANGVTELGCWPHARRKFFDVHKTSGSVIAKQALRRIGELYTLEAEWRAHDPIARVTDAGANCDPRSTP